MTDSDLGETSDRLSHRMEEAHTELAKRWLDRLTALLAIKKDDIFPTQRLLDHIPDLIVEIARYLRVPEDLEIAANTAVMVKAAELGTMRFEQRGSVHQLMREYQILSEILETFLRAEGKALTPDADVAQAMGVLSRASQAVHVLQQQTVDTFVACYTDTIERQTAQLRNFNRLVSHEIRQPLGVLRVLGGVFPVPAGDAQAARLLDTLKRNVERLGDVTDKIERLTRLASAPNSTPTDQVVDVSGMASEIGRQLSDMAEARGVELVVAPDLPFLTLDAGRLELVLMNLFANGIKYADPSKPSRFVRISELHGLAGPAFEISDNGIGIPAGKIESIFEQFVRVHESRDGELGTEGLGLGLSIVRECMDAMGAAVSVSSAEGDGTTFALQFPATAQQTTTPTAL